YQWLRDHTPDDSVVLALDWDDIYLLPIYTRNDLFCGHMQISNRTPKDELLHYFAAWHFLGLPRERLQQMVELSVASASRAHPQHPYFPPVELAECASIALDILYWPYAPRCDGVPIADGNGQQTNPAFARTAMQWYDELDWKAQWQAAS